MSHRFIWRIRLDDHEQVGDIVYLETRPRNRMHICIKSVRVVFANLRAKSFFMFGWFCLFFGAENESGSIVIFFLINVCRPRASGSWKSDGVSFKLQAGLPNERKINEGKMSYDSRFEIFVSFFDFALITRCRAKSVMNPIFFYKKCSITYVFMTKNFFYWPFEVILKKKK